MLRKTGIRIRLLAALLCVSIIPAAFIGVYAYQSYTRSVTGKLAASAEETIRLLDLKLTMEFGRYGQLIDVVSVADEVQSALIEQHGGAGLFRAIDGLLLRSGHFRSLCVADVDGNKVYDAGHAQISADVFNALVTDAEKASTGDSLSRADSSRSGNLAIGRKIYHFPEGVEPIGYIFVFVNDALTYEVFNEASFGGGEMALISENGRLLAGDMLSPDTDIADSDLYAKLTAAAATGRHSFTAEADGVQSLIVFSHSLRYNTYLLAAIPLSYIQTDARQAGQRTAIFAAVSAVLCIALSLWIYRSVERRKRDLELEALQYQINPHFLFNTLGTLKWAAVINDAPPVISEGITSLSQLLKSVLLDKDEMVTVREELSNLAHYFTIQKIRYADCFNVEQIVDETLLDSLIPRFILQPLAENAVLHGAVGEERQIVITVRCERTPDSVLLEIRDNGRGFDTKKLQAHSDKRFSGIGLSNVDERLKLYFGANRGLQIVSNPGEGTVCRVLIPYTGGTGAEADD